MKDKHGLSRTIPEPIKLMVRQECGFGCVCCGLAISMYEHIIPEWNDAKIHNPQAIALLCGSCHDRVTRGGWSKERIQEARENPFCIRNGHCPDSFDVGRRDVRLRIGSSEITGFTRIFSVEDKQILAVHPPEIDGGPFQLSGVFFDRNEGQVFEIVRNEWIDPANRWDITCEGPTITIRMAPGQIALRLTCYPRVGIYFRNMDMTYKGSRIISDAREFSFRSSDDSGFRIGERLFTSTNRDKVLFHSENGKASLGGGSEKGSFQIGPLRTRVLGEDPFIPRRKKPRWKQGKK